MANDRYERFGWGDYVPPMRIPHENIERILGRFKDGPKKVEARKLLNEGRLKEAMDLLES